MAYVSKEKKAAIKVELDKVLKGTGIKYSLAVDHHSSIVLTISKGPVDFISNFQEQQNSSNFWDKSSDAPKAITYIDVNPYHYQNNFTGKTLELVAACIKALNLNNYNNSDSRYDYFDVGHYVHMNIGKWNKPYELTA
jgi:hypothetical protein